ncbi:MAG: hypothetical protein IKJ04_00105, partial [Clostridia bacterium]|nr:hypothetical protein [Clostridia bacterium]
KLYSALLYASKQGSVHDGVNGLTDEEVAEILKTPDDYDVRIRVETSHKDADGKQTVYEYRYYHYSERQSMITVNGGEGEFRVLRSFTDKIAESAAKIITGEPIKATDKYS